MGITHQTLIISWMIFCGLQLLDQNFRYNPVNDLALYIARVIAAMIMIMHDEQLLVVSWFISHSCHLTSIIALFHGCFVARRSLVNYINYKRGHYGLFYMMQPHTKICQYDGIFYHYLSIVYNTWALKYLNASMVLILPTWRILSNSPHWYMTSETMWIWTA